MEVRTASQAVAFVRNGARFSKKGQIAESEEQPGFSGSRVGSRVDADFRSRATSRWRSMDTTSAHGRTRQKSGCQASKHHGARSNAHTRRANGMWGQGGFGTRLVVHLENMHIQLGGKEGDFVESRNPGFGRPLRKQSSGAALVQGSPPWAFRREAQAQGLGGRIWCSQTST